MNVKRTATIVVVAAALLAWLAGAAPSKRQMPLIVTTPRPIDLRGIELTNEIARLHDRLRPKTPPTERRRNLFSFRSAPAASVPATEARSALPAKIETAAQNVGEPALKLVGIAEDAGADGPERTAIISGEGQLFMVKQGDAVTVRYRVTRISPDAVELNDPNAGIVRRLVMK